MTHWGWYWKVKKQHSPKPLCSSFEFLEIDSFDMFRNKEIIHLIKESKDRIALQIPKYNFIATLQDDNSLKVRCNKFSYIIPVEKKPCNYGGFYHFFCCPLCKARMRKLYCIMGLYICRKCAGLGYYSQRLRPSERCLTMSLRVKDCLKNRAGSLKKKPPRMHHSTFQKLKIKYVKYDEQRFNEKNKENLAWFGSDIERFMDCYLPPDDAYDGYVERQKSEEELP